MDSLFHGHLVSPVWPLVTSITATESYVSSFSCKRAHSGNETCGFFFFSLCYLAFFLPGVQTLVFYKVQINYHIKQSSVIYLCQRGWRVLHEKEQWL